MANAVETAPVKVYDVSKGDPVAGTMSPEEIQPAVQSGQFSLPKGMKVPVVSPEGDLGEIDASEAPQAFQSGYNYATPEMQNNIKFSTPGEQIKAGLEAVAEGVAGPIAPLVERGFGAKPENIRARAEANPWISSAGKVGGLGLGMFTGTGEGALLNTVGKAAPKAVGLAESASLMGKIGAGAARAAAEMAVLSSGDEISKLILEDPHQSLETAVANVKFSTLLGAGGGAAFGAVPPLWKATVGDRAGQFIEDMKGRFAERAANPNPLESLIKEVSDYHGNISKLNDEVWGSSGVKAETIDRLMPAMNDTIKESTMGLAERLTSTAEKMAADPAAYPGRLVNEYQAQVSKVLDAVTHPEATPGKIFDAIQTTKQWAQDALKDAERYGRFDPEYQFGKQVSNLSKELRPFLEDAKVWGEAGKAQQEINSAASKFFPALKDFDSKFTVKLGGERVVDPGKVNTFYNQIGKPNAEIKREVLENFFGSSEKYRDEVGKAYEKIGQASPFQNTSLNQVEQALRKLSPGAKAADVIVDKALAGLAGKSVGAAVGGAAGALVGHPFIGAMIGEHALGGFFGTVIPAIFKPLMDRAASPEGLRAAAEYGSAIAKGNNLIQKSTAAIFKPAAEVITSKKVADENSRERLDKQVQMYANNPEKLMDVGGHASYYMPNHAMAIGETAGRVVQHLNSIRPQVVKQSPLDSDVKPSKMEMAEYHRALDIAEQPLTVLKSVKDGSVTPQDVNHLKSMYPSLYTKMASNLHEEIATRVDKGENIPYKSRLGLSLFLGEPLDSSMTQQSLQAIQMAQHPQAQAPQQSMGPAPGKRGSMKELGKLSSMYQTPGQARVKDKTTA